MTPTLDTRWSRRSSGAVEDSDDVVGVADDVEDAHPPAALAADSHVDGEHSSEQVGPAETARARGGRGATVRRAGAGEVEVEGELLPGRRDPRRRGDASTTSSCEHAGAARGRTGGRGTRPAACRRGWPRCARGLEEDAHAAVGERHDAELWLGRRERLAGVRGASRRDP